MFFAKDAQHFRFYQLNHVFNAIISMLTPIYAGKSDELPAVDANPPRFFKCFCRSGFVAEMQPTGQLILAK